MRGAIYHFVNFVRDISDFTKVSYVLFESHSYLQVSPAHKLRQNLACYQIGNQYFDDFEKWE